MSAIKSYLHHGVTRTQIHALMINRFSFPDQYRDCLAVYFTRQMSGKMFASRIHHGTITESNKQYLIVYHQCTPAAACNAAQVRLSFREASVDYELPSFVLVKIIPQEPQNIQE